MRSPMTTASARPSVSSTASWALVTVKAGGGVRGAGVRLATRARQRRGEGRVRAAAAAHHARARLHDALHDGSELRGLHVVHGASLHDVRQPGVRSHHHGAARAAHQLAGHRFQLRRPQRAVHAHHVRAQRRQHGRRHARGRAEERAPVLAERHGGEDGQVVEVLRRQHRRLRLAQIRHGLDEHDVAPGVHHRAHLLGEYLVGLLERQRAQGLQQHADGAEAARHVAGAGRAGVGRRRAVDVGHRRAALQLVRVGAERVRGDHLGAGAHIAGMDVRDGVRVAEVQQVGQLAVRREAAFLQERAHGAVLHEVVLPAQHALEVRVGDAQPRERVGQAARRQGRRRRCGQRACSHPWQILPWSPSAQRPASAHEARVERCRGVRRLALEQAHDGRDALRGHEQVARGGGEADAARRIERREERGLHGKRQVAEAGAVAEVRAQAARGGLGHDAGFLRVGRRLHERRCGSPVQERVRGARGRAKAQRPLALGAQRARHEHRLAGAVQMTRDVAPFQHEAAARQRHVPGIRGCMIHGKRGMEAARAQALAGGHGLVEARAQGRHRAFARRSPGSAAPRPYRRAGPPSPSGAPAGRLPGAAHRPPRPPGATTRAARPRRPARCRAGSWCTRADRPRRAAAGPSAGRMRTRCPPRAASPGRPRTWPEA